MWRCKRERERERKRKLERAREWERERERERERESVTPFSKMAVMGDVKFLLEMGSWFWLPEIPCF